MNEHAVDLAILELNRKFSAIVAMYQNDPDIPDAEEYAMSLVAEDVERITTYVGKAPHYDRNYSCTWGYKACGIYESLSEMEAIAFLVDAGF